MMGKVTGFLEFQRLSEVSEAPAARVKHWREFVGHLNDEQAATQGARCMDCGTPFCMNGCPINNIIPDWNDLVFRNGWQTALDVLHSTNNFPEFTGRICPAPCEEACTLRINNDPVGIKSIEHAIIDKGWEQGWVTPRPAVKRTGKHVAIVGSGPAGLACAQQLARAGHDVVVFEKNDRAGGLLRYGIPDFKLEKVLIERRLEQMRTEGVEFRTNCSVGGIPAGAGNTGAELLDPKQLMSDFDAIVIATGAEQPRDLPIQGRELSGIHFAMDFLPLQNRRVAGDSDVPNINAADKHVVVIGGGDTGSACVGPSNRHGAASVTQFELLPMPPSPGNNPVWPYWPIRLRSSSSHEEGCNRDWAVSTKRFKGTDGHVNKLVAVRVNWDKNPDTGAMRMVEVPGSEFEMQADLVLLAMGFVSPVTKVLDAFGVERDTRGNARADTEGAKAYHTSVAKVFAAGDARRGQSLVVWAIREGRQCARAVDEFLMNQSDLPR
jgi:glutamate synthase (NADPH/NADH) small chain